MSDEMQVVAVVVAGAVGVPLVQGLKKLAQATGRSLEGLAALYVTAGVSVGLAVLALGLTGAFAQPLSWEMVGGAIAGVFSVATLIYKTITDPARGEAGGVKAGGE